MHDRNPNHLSTLDAGDGRKQQLEHNQFQQFANGCAGFAFGIGVVANLLVFVVSWPLLRIPEGSHVRPMHLGLVFMLGIATAGIGLPCALIGLAGTRWRRSATAVFLTISPAPLGVAIWEMVSAVLAFGGT